MCSHWTGWPLHRESETLRTFDPSSVDDEIPDPYYSGIFEEVYTIVAGHVIPSWKRSKLTWCTYWLD